MFSRSQDAAPAAPMAPRTAPAKARGAADGMWGLLLRVFLQNAGNNFRRILECSRRAH